MTSRMEAPATARELTSREQPDADDTLIAELHELIVKRDRQGALRRGVHVKMHGLMRAEFTVPPGLPPELRVGLFAHPATYRAWVRFSNSSDSIKPDGKGDILGMAIKLMGVPGRKVLPSQADAPTHDFILISAPTFPSRTPAQFGALVAAMMGSLWDKLAHFLPRPRVAWYFLKWMVEHANLLQVRFFSAVPYAFGPHTVKYVATPRVAAPDAMPANPSPNFLREVAAAQLAEGDAVFDFSLQFQRDEDCMPVDDPRCEWSLELSPPRKVATLRILPQVFDDAAIDAYGEALSFSPWHCLPEHQPLGGINRARRAVYETLSKFRRESSHESQVEPADWDPKLKGPMP
jgi:hypothetical protein